MTVLREGSIQDVVSTHRKVNNLPKTFFQHIDDFVYSLVGTIQFVQVASGKVRSPQITMELISGVFLSSIGNPLSCINMSLKCVDCRTHAELIECH